MNEDWTPQQSDIEWLRGLLSLIKNGGVWANSHGAYRVDHDAKTITLICELPTANYVTLTTIHDRTRIVAEQIGWTLRDDEQKDDAK